MLKGSSTRDPDKEIVLQSEFTYRTHHRDHAMTLRSFHAHYDTATASSACEDSENEKHFTERETFKSDGEGLYSVNRKKKKLEKRGRKRKMNDVWTEDEEDLAEIRKQEIEKMKEKKKKLQQKRKMQQGLPNREICCRNEFFLDNDEHSDPYRMIDNGNSSQDSDTNLGRGMRRRIEKKPFDYDDLNKPDQKPDLNDLKRLISEGYTFRGNQVIPPFSSIKEIHLKEQVKERSREHSKAQSKEHLREHSRDHSREQSKEPMEKRKRGRPRKHHHLYFHGENSKLEMESRKDEFGSSKIRKRQYVDEMDDRIAKKKSRIFVKIDEPEDENGCQLVGTVGMRLRSRTLQMRSVETSPSSLELSSEEMVDNSLVNYVEREVDVPQQRVLRSRSFTRANAQETDTISPATFVHSALTILLPSVPVLDPSVSETTVSEAGNIIEGIRVQVPHIEGLTSDEEINDQDILNSLPQDIPEHTTKSKRRTTKTIRTGTKIESASSSNDEPLSTVAEADLTPLLLNTGSTRLQSCRRRKIGGTVVMKRKAHSADEAEHDELHVPKRIGVKFNLDNIEKKASVDTQNIDGVMASQVNERPKTLTLPKAVQHQFKRDGYESAPEMRRDGISRSLRPRKGNTNDIANPLTSTRPGLALMTGFSVPMQENSNESALTDNGKLVTSSFPVSSRRVIDVKNSPVEQKREFTATSSSPNTINQREKKSNSHSSTKLFDSVDSARRVLRSYSTHSNAAQMPLDMFNLVSELNDFEQRTNETATTRSLRSRVAAEQTTGSRTDSKQQKGHNFSNESMSDPALPETPESQLTPEPSDSNNNMTPFNSKKSPVKMTPVSLEHDEPTSTYQLRKRDMEAAQNEIESHRKRKRGSQNDDSIGNALGNIAKKSRFKENTPTSDKGSEKGGSADKTSEKRVLRPRKEPELKGPNKNHIRKQSAPKKLKEDLINATAAESKQSSVVLKSVGKKRDLYIQTFENVMKVYHHIFNSSTRVPFYLKRNLSYLKKVRNVEDLGKFRFGESAPPLLHAQTRKSIPLQLCRVTWVYSKFKFVEGVTEHSFPKKEDPKKDEPGKDWFTWRPTKEEFNAKAEKLFIKSRILKVIVHSRGYKHTRFELDNLFGYTLSVEALYRSLKEEDDCKAKQILQSILKSCELRGIPPRVYIPPIEQSSVMLTPSVSRDSSIENKVPIVYVDTISFTSCIHQLLPGKHRCGWAEVYLIYQKDDKLTTPVPLFEGRFPMWINGENRTTLYFNKTVSDYHKCHLLVKFGILRQENETEGVRLRLRESKENKKRDYPPFDKKLIEKWLWGTLVCYDTNITTGFLAGKHNMDLIDEDNLEVKNHAKRGFLKSLLTEIKKVNINPILRAELRRRTQDEVYDSDSSGSECSEIDAETQEESDNDSQISHDDNPRKNNRTLVKPPSTIGGLLGAYTGKFKSNDGTYINHAEMLKYLFKNPNILQNKKKLAAINQMLPLKTPDKLQYRFLCCEQIEEDGETNRKKLTFIQFKRINWLIANQKENTDRCIICNRRFPDLYTLMLHYNSSYPRLMFLFSVRERGIDDILQKPDDSFVWIDVMLDSNYIELNEVMPTDRAGPIRRADNGPASVIVNKAEVRYVREQMRMDLTIFTRPLNVPEMVDETKRYITRFIDTETGLPASFGAKIEYDPKIIPQPGFLMLANFSTRIIQDYIDIDQITKNFMCTWNILMYAIGRYNQAILGPYLQHKLFINVFFYVIKSEDWYESIENQLMEYADAGALSQDEVYDLWMRLYQRHYNPLTDRNSGLYRDLINHAAKKHRTMKRALKKGRIANHLEVPPTYRRNPWRVRNIHYRDKLVAFLYYRTKTVHKLDYRRNFLADPYKKLPGNPMETREFLEGLEPCMGAYNPDND